MAKVTEQIFKYLLDKFIKAKLIVKGLIIIVFIILLFIAARLGFFGEPGEKTTYNLVNKRIFITDKPYTTRDTNQKNQNLDGSPIRKVSSKKQNSEDTLFNNPENERINLRINFLVNERQGILNHSYYSGDQISIIFNTEYDCYLMLICVDNHNIYDLLKSNYSCQHTSSKTDEVIKYTLDKTIGNEIVFLFSSKVIFNYEKDIKPYLYKMQSALQKGPDISKEINLNKKDIFYKTIYYNHK